MKWICGHANADDGVLYIGKHNDHLKIWNPAVLPDGWTLGNLLGEHASHPYNPDIANAFFRSG